MLSVRIDGREVETTPVSLARLVFDGRADRHCPSKTPGSTAERSLEQSLEFPHCQALTDELLCRLQSMYASQSPAVDIHELCRQVEGLCRWRWTSPRVAARFLWAAAWLNDVMDRLENAAQFYDEFLQTSSRENHLRLLAYNNRGVLRIRLGRLEGVQDLARAAVPRPEATANEDRPGPDSATGDSQAMGLPAACFNLLNLINVSLESTSLARVVDEELADFFAQAPEEFRTWWLGHEISGPSDEPAGTPEHSRASLRILRDPTYRRLNMLTSRLAARANRLAGGESPSAARLSAGAAQLALWESCSNGKELPADGHGIDAGTSADGDYSYCAEAANLLLSEEIPPSLMRLESPLARAEQAVREELASIESRLVAGQYELVESRLQVQRRILSSLNRRGRLAGLLARVDGELGRVRQLRSQSEQLDLQRACASLVSSVEQFCGLTDSCRAQKEHDELTSRLRQIQAGLEPQRGCEVAVLLDELAARLDRHVRRLIRLEIRRGIREPMRYLRQNWPADWAVPVPEDVYQALAQCHQSDPQCLVEDWAALKDRLDDHQGQHHLQKALAVLRAKPFSWDETDEDLMTALTLKPDLWLTVAPLFGLFGPSSARDRWETTAGGDGVLSRAGGLLERVFQQMEGRARRCMELWRCVEATLSPVLDGEDLDAIAQVRGLAERCLDYWPTAAGLPGRVDPRNPVTLFLESCEKARRLIEAGQRLNARPPQWDQARRGYDELLGLGLDTCDQLRRSAVGYYLAAYHEADAPHVQRQVLAGLETWVAAKSQEAWRQVRGQDVVQEIAGLRAAASETGPTAGSERDALGGGADSCPNDSKGGGHDPQEGKSEI